MSISSRVVQRASKIQEVETRGRPVKEGLKATTSPALTERTTVVHKLGVYIRSDIIPWSRVVLAVPDNVRMTSETGQIPTCTSTGDANDGVDGDSLNGKPSLKSSLANSVCNDHDY